MDEKRIGPKIRNPVADYKYDLSHMPPECVDAEEIVLGAMMLDKHALPLVMALIHSADVFYKPSHTLIFQAIQDLQEKAIPVDIITVTNQLKKNGTLGHVGGPFEITQLTSRVGSITNVEYHCYIIIEHFLKRETIRIGQDIVRNGYDHTTDAFEVVGSASVALTNLIGAHIGNSDENLRDTALRIIQEGMAANKDTSKRLLTGFKAIDEMITYMENGDLIIIAGRPGMGKCLGKGTMVMMFDGSIKAVEDIVVGDLLMGNDSTPRRVLSLARGREMMYWIRQNKAMDYRVNESHILSLKASGTEGSRTHGEVINISVKDYLQKSTKFQVKHKGYRVSVEFPEKAIPVDPYFIGVWLGDGDKKSIRITKDEKELTEYLNDYAKKLGLQLTISNPKNRCQTNSITRGYTGGSPEWSLQGQLRLMNLLENKHIPEQYMINSTNNRLELLAGLLDTDGHYMPYNHCFEFTQKSVKLSRQVKWLCDSLGFRATVAEKIGKIKSTGFIGKYCKIIISGNVEIIPTKIQRKQALVAKPNKDWKVTGITIEKDCVDDYYGFELDGNKLFLLQDCTVTHNTSLAMGIAINLVFQQEKPVAFFSLEMQKEPLVRRILSVMGEIDGERIKSFAFSYEENKRIEEVLEKFMNAPLYIEDKPAITIIELRSRAVYLKNKYGIRLLVVDYLQLMKGNQSKTHGRESEIAEISRGLKAIAKELKIPVIALAQLSRETEKRGGDKKPQLSDLRESGAIEQDADEVWFPYRPEYYGKKHDANNNSVEGLAQIIRAKARNGALKTVVLRWDDKFTRFSDMEEAIITTSTDPIPDTNIVDSDF